MPTFLRCLAASSLGTTLLLSAACAASPDQLAGPDQGLAGGVSETRAAGQTFVAGPAIGARDIRTVLGKHRGGVLLTADSVVGVENFYVFDAFRTKRGTASGSFKFVSSYRGVEVAFSGVVLCYTVNGAQARIGGVVTASSFDEIPVGTTETWSITDNDELVNGGRDSGSSLLGGNADYALGYCQNGLPHPEHVFLSGGVEISR